MALAFAVIESVILFFFVALRSTLSYPTPCLDIIFNFFDASITLPVSLSVLIDTNGTAKVDEIKLSKVLQEMVDLSPRGIREHLKLNRPIYARTAAYGHFGRNPDAEGGFSWEQTDLVESLRSAFGAN